ncbi:unnamed protein product [Tetraodon nigroviridis]|uniref:Chromosome 1 SCAF14998, whole genome shotgun sequence n=1 Tax=Tetraodon nigroviridis TaxID=99883 RepID=Q4RTA2_TETNG|nr:unnamed protein product [Tetraodon nigroviridis]
MDSGEDHISTVDNMDTTLAGLGDEVTLGDIDAVNMSLMDISKIFSLLQPKEEDERSERSQALNAAVSADDVVLLSDLLSQESYRKAVNARSGWGIPVTPLRTAAALGHLRCLEVLLEHGAEVDSLDVKAQTPLFTAVSGKHLDCVVALLKAGADPNGSQYNNCSPVLTAAREGDVDVLRELLRGPLYISAVYGHLDCFKLLLLHGANPDYNCTDEKMLARIKQPKTVLETCFHYGCGEEYVQLLVDFGADVYLPTLIVDKFMKQNEALALLLKERVCPKTLMTQARLSIRRYIKLPDKEAGIDWLDLPQMLRNYLKHNTTELL